MSAPPYRLGIVIPAYNEAERLPATLAAIASAAVPGVELLRVLVAENGSTDDTVALARAAGARHGLPLDVRPLPVSGKARAIKLGAALLLAECADLDGVLLMDADNATDLGQLARFDLCQRDVIQVASRHLPGSRIVPLGGRMPLSRRLMSAASRRLTQLLLGLPLRDTQCGFKLVPAAAVPLLVACRTNGWMIDAEFLARARRAGVCVREVAVRWVEMDGSKVDPLRDALRSLRDLWLIRRTLAAEG